MWTELLSAIALVLILEGITPFINPDALRKMFMMAVQLSNATLRFIGLSSMILGLCLLYFIR
ncbi:MAG: DUF2065 domain-containing protein [Proteobacteria bacterium]|nr:DUF2065 domain-containing protein [Pseudomonadota bacterium]MCZ6525943.1 DUF2065 domain-containing protein [Gammaproteobacteria bacterium]